MRTYVLLSSTISFAIYFFFLFCISPRNGVHSVGLTGHQATCNDSDEALSVEDIPKMKCFNCTCQNGLIECKKKKCPPVEGCYLLEEPQEDVCCQKCKGCTEDGVYHESGTEWTDPNAPCKLFTCNAGVTTESDVYCYASCETPTPPALGKCCPTCTGCKVKGKIVRQDTQIMPKEDPCVVCNYSAGIVTCVKKTCPILNCPKSKIVHGFEECCPQCLGFNTHISPPNGACLLGTTVHQTGTQFVLDECTNCACNNSTLHCQKKSCPILQCKKEYQKTLPGECCAQCEKIEDKIEVPINEDDEKQVKNEVEKLRLHNFSSLSSCHYNGKTYKSGESWNATACETCRCDEGNIECAAILCPAVSCPPNSMVTVPEGQCCPVCVEGQGVCTIFGGSHFRTFDGKLYAFIGSCKYQLVNDCDSGTFNIRIKNSVTGNDVSIKRVSLKFGSTKVDLQQNKNTKVNDEIIDLPYSLPNKVDIVEINENIVISSTLGIKVQWNYIGFLEIAVPKSYRRKLCGLCGNFNSMTSDDLTTREGILVDDPAIFAQSWTSGDEVCLETRKYGIRGCDPSKDKRLCSYMKGSVFEKCLKKINVTSYYEICLKDMCECSPDDMQCHCESFANYVRDCRRLGILIPRWRKAVGC